jgi:NitT/TauT family transport system permease protein
LAKPSGITIRRILLKVALGLVIPALILLLWWLASPSGSEEGPGSLVPTIGEVAYVLTHPFTNPKNLDSSSLASSFAISFLRVLIGYILAVMTAVPLGLLAGRHGYVRDLLSPTVEVLRPISPIAWMPVVILIFGFSSIGTWLFGEEYWQHDILAGLTVGIILIVWSGAFFPLFIDTMHGASSVKEIYIELAHVNGASRWQIFRKVILPHSVPAILTGMRISIGLAWRAIVAAEIFPGTRGGLGYMIIASHDVLEYQWAFAAIVVIAVTGLVVNSGFEFLERRLGRWQAKER